MSMMCCHVIFFNNKFLFKDVIKQETNHYKCFEGYKTKLDEKQELKELNILGQPQINISKHKDECHTSTK